MIDPATVVFGVRALVRLGAAARGAYEQGVRERPIPLIDLDYPPFDDDERLWNVFDGSADHFHRVRAGGDLADCWSAPTRVKDDASRQRLHAEAVQVVGSAALAAADFSGDWRALRLQSEPAALVLAAQFRQGAGPPRPAVRFALVFADVALGYVGANPGLFGAGGNGDKLIAALAENVRELLPDIDNREDWRQQEGAAICLFAERAFAITLEAGLQTVAANPQYLVEQKHYQALLGNVLAPLVEEYRRTPGTRPGLEQLRDTLLGPMATAALATLYENQSAFLGAGFDPSRAVGAVTEAALGVAREREFAEIFTGEGLTRIYRAALGVAVERPQLFLAGEGGDKAAARDLLARLGTVLKSAPVPFQGGLAAELGVTVLKCLRDNAPQLLRAGDDAWRGTGAALADAVLGGFADGLRQAGPAAALDRIFSREQAVRLAGIFMTHAAATPGMIAGEEASPELKGIVTVFASAVASRDPLLMTGEDWLAVAAAVMSEAGRNPMRLFAITDSAADPAQAEVPLEKQVLARTLSAVLDAAEAGFRSGGRTAGALLFGGTLREALTVAVAAAAGHADQAQADAQPLGRLIERLNRLAQAHPGRIGAGAWLHLFRRYAASVIESGSLEQPSVETLLAELKSAGGAP